ncbi:hypothetical protein B0H13DRAFT_1930397 [Mycena leptocephala]|nr:hypothetical protein B0H13DRAFT_1930397 [Mycena leptocephala]
MAEIKRRMGDAGVAQIHLNEARRFANLPANLCEEAKVLQATAQCMRDLGDYQNGLNQLHRAKELLGFCVLADLKFREGDTTSAKDILQDCLKYGCLCRVKPPKCLGRSSKLSSLLAASALRTNKNWKPFQAEQIEDLNVDLNLSKHSTSMVSMLPYNYHVLDHIGFHVELWSANVQLLQEFGPISKGNLPLHLTGYFSIRQPPMIDVQSHLSSLPQRLVGRLGGQCFVYNADLNARRRSLRHHSVRLGKI